MTKIFVDNIINACVDMITLCNTAIILGVKNMIYAVTYSNSYYQKAKDYNLRTAIFKGKADRTISYSEKDIDEIFLKRNEAILSQKKGAGLWLWKPYIIFDALEKINMGDYLIYSDAATYFVKSIQLLIDAMTQDVMSFQIPYTEEDYTKDLVFSYFNCEASGNITETYQRTAAYILIKKTPESISFIKKWLNHCQVEELMIDKKSDPIDCNTRYDQSIFSVMSKLNSYESYRDPSQCIYSYSLMDYLQLAKKNEVFKKSSYPVIIVRHRKNIVTLSMRIKFRMYVTLVDFLLRDN